MKIKINLNDVLAAFMLGIYFAELVFPRITVLFPSSVTCLICFCLWMFLVITVDRKFLLWKNNFVLIVIYLYLIIYPLLFGNDTISNRYMAMSLILCGCIIFRYYYAYNKLKILTRIIIITIILSLITMLITYEQLLINPYISRSIKSSGELSVVLSKQGIGGYSFIYFITALSIPALYYSMKVNHKWKRIVAIAWYLFSIVFIIKSNYMTALLTMVVCSALLILLSYETNKKCGFALRVFFIIALIIIVCNLENIIILMKDFLPSRISSVLVSGIGDSVMNSIWQEFMLDRWPVILNSIEAFLSHPILGLVGSGSLRYDGNFLVGFGQHSFIFDTFALFGVFGGIICGYAALSPLKKSVVWEKHTSFRIAMIICMVMLYFLNNATESIALVISIIAPCCACILSYDNKG